MNRKIVSLVLALVCVFANVASVFAKTENKLKDKKEAAEAIVFIGEDADKYKIDKTDSAQAVFVLGDIEGDKNLDKLGVAKIDINVKKSINDYFIFSYSVKSSVSSMLSSTTNIALYNTSGKLLSKAPLSTQSESSVDSFSSEITMWVGNVSKVKVVIENSSITCNDKESYRAIEYKSYYANRK